MSLANSSPRIMIDAAIAPCDRSSHLPFARTGRTRVCLGSRRAIVRTTWIAPTPMGTRDRRDARRTAELRSCRPAPSSMTASTPSRSSTPAVPLSVRSTTLVPGATSRSRATSEMSRSRARFSCTTTTSGRSCSTMRTAWSTVPASAGTSKPFSSRMNRTRCRRSGRSSITTTRSDPILTPPSGYSTCIRHRSREYSYPCGLGRPSSRIRLLTVRTGPSAQHPDEHRPQVRVSLASIWSSTVAGVTPAACRYSIFPARRSSSAVRIGHRTPRSECLRVTAA